MHAVFALLLIVPVAACAKPVPGAAEPPATGPAQTLTTSAFMTSASMTRALAATDADPLAAKLGLYLRLLTPGGATASELAAFISANPGWPNQAQLAQRLQEAMLIERDDALVFDLCRQFPPAGVPAMLRCAGLAAAGLAGASGAPQADSLARRAWLQGIADPAAEAAFMLRWGASVTPEDQWRRFDRLAWTDNAAAASRQAARLPQAMRPVAEARLALKRDDPTAPALAAALSEPARSDPALVLELARWYRRAGLDRDAAGVWTGPGRAAEAAAPAERRAAFWDERNRLARRLLAANDAALAYAAASAPAANPDSAPDAAFLAGWLALRRLNQPAPALAHFTTLAGLSASAITQARAHYWLGRTHDATHDDAGAKAEYAAAARWPTTFYGQLAALALGDDAVALGNRITRLQDPRWTDDRAEAFLAQDVARAPVLLVAMGDRRHARAFLARLDDGKPSPGDRSLAAQLSLRLGLPDQAVAVARRAGRDGVMLPGSGWPAAVQPPPGPVEPAVVLGLVRQESSFDADALSPAGARGLMQLMPATAAGVARRLGLKGAPPSTLADADANMRLGTEYLQGLLVQFNQTLPLAIAGYNAGPSRVQDWLTGAPDDPAAGGAGMVDWIETIPFNETRNYVQRVIENIVIYRAQRGTAAPHPIERQSE